MKQQVFRTARQQHVEKPEPGAEAGRAVARPRDDRLGSDGKRVPVGTCMREVRLAVAMTTHSSPNRVTQSEPLEDIGITFTACAPAQADPGATSTLPETADTSAAQGM